MGAVGQAAGRVRQRVRRTAVESALDSVDVERETAACSAGTDGERATHGAPGGRCPESIGAVLATVNVLAAAAVTHSDPAGLHETALTV